MEKLEITDDVRNASRKVFNAFVDMLVPFRPELHRYCRRLTGDIWDAEDLMQDTLLKGFAALGMAQGSVENPRGYLIRIATNLWIDTQRRRAAEVRVMAKDAAGAIASNATP